MDDESSDWIHAASMNHWHGWGWQMVSLGNKAYAMGGYRDYSGDTPDIAIEYMERYDPDTNSWTNVASYPLYIYNHCMAADEETGRIWVMGGTYRSGSSNHDWSELRYYQVVIIVLMTEKNCCKGIYQHLAWYLEHDMAQTTPRMWNYQTCLDRRKKALCAVSYTHLRAHET